MNKENDYDWSDYGDNKMKIYIAGPMLGYENNNHDAFMIAEEKLKHVPGDIVLNPASLPLGLNEREYMDICLAMLRCCDAIYLLNGWSASAGALAEYALACKLGLKVINQS